MIHIQPDRSFNQLTTFKVGGPIRAFIELTDAQDLEEALHTAEGNRMMILGGGSNMLVSDDLFDGTVIRINNRGIEVQDTTEPSVKLLVVQSGETWDDVVQFAVDHKLWGLENLSRIPGKAGAFAVQNVGAYGPEAKDVITYVDAYDRTANKVVRLTNEQCGFTYRTSIFNSTEKGRYVILETGLRLSMEPVRFLSYPDLKRVFGENATPTQQEIRQAIKEIRDAKFPFPAESLEGNAGSFFKNSVLTEEEFATVDEHFASNLPDHVQRLRDIKHKFPQAQGIKLPSAFIMEACGLKGYRMGNVMINPTQPVVVLNATGQATATEVLMLVQAVRKIVQEKAGLHLYTEPELINFSEETLSEYGFNDQEIDRYLKA